jgi:multicomponent Na+:H+ antiporter subunit F
MSDIIFYSAMIWMTGLLIISILMVIRSPSAMTRILALDTLTLVLIALLVLYTTTTESSYYLDAAILLALLSFIATLAASRYYSEGRIF